MFFWVSAPTSSVLWEMNFRVERQRESLHQSTRKKSFSLVCLALEKGFSASWLLCFATWNGRCHRDPSSILCYLFVGCVNNMEKLLMSSEELKWWVLHSTNCFAPPPLFKNTFSRKVAFHSGQECTTTLENLNCCFSPSLISGSLTVLVGSKKWKESVRTNAVVFHDFN